MLLITTSKPILLLALALAAVAVTSGARNNPGKHLARRGPQAATAPPPPKTGGPGRKRSPQTATAPPKTGGPGPGGRRKRNPHDTTGTPPDSSSDPNFSDFDDVPPSRRANPNPTSESPSSSRRAPQDEEEEYEDEDVDQPETETEDDPPDSQSQPTVETETIEDNVPRGLTQISPRWLPRAPQDSEPIEDVNPPDAQPQAPPELEEPVPETDGEDPAVVRSLTQISPRWLPRSPQDTDVDGDTQGGDASTPGPDTSESDGGLFRIVGNYTLFSSRVCYGEHRSSQCPLARRSSYRDEPPTSSLPALSKARTQLSFQLRRPALQSCFGFVKFTITRTQETTYPHTHVEKASTVSCPLQQGIYARTRRYESRFTGCKPPPSAPVAFIYLYNGFLVTSLRSSHLNDVVRFASEKSGKCEILGEEDADVAANLTAGSSIVLDDKQADRLRWKIDKNLLPLMCIMYLMTFADKTTLGQSAVMGIIPGAHLNQTQFNWLGSVFYLSYLVFEYPQNLALQRYPVGKWMSANIFVWAVALLCHAACSSFGGLLAVRFILGACEGAITPGFMIVTSMFYTRAEQTKRVGYWFLMNGFAIVFLGFVSFGLLHTSTDNFMPWQWLMITTGLITLVTSVVFWFYFPDSPTTAHFLTPDERIQAVQRIKINQTGVENKRWKREQFMETVQDPKIWVMFLFTAVGNIFNSLSNQRQIIVNQFGFSQIETTLIGCVDGVAEILMIWFAVNVASTRLVGRGYAGALMYVPATAGALLVNLLPSHNKVGLLFSYWVSIFAICPFVIFLGWMGSLTSGHTKRITTNTIVLIGYCVGNFAGPFVWKRKYQPRNHVPWALIAACNLVSGLLLLLLRYMLARENKRRDMAAHDETFDAVYYVSHVNADGTTVEKKVDKAFLDLTDLQNKDFRYVL